MLIACPSCIAVSVLVCVRARMHEAHSWTRVWAEVTSFSPRQIEAPDELQVEGMTAVQHGESYNVGLFIYNIIQPQQREILT